MLKDTGRVQKIEAFCILPQALAKAHLRDFDPEGWTPADCDTARYTIYKAVDIKGVEIVPSQAYLQARTRVSYYVRVDYEGEGTYVARISKFLKVSKAGAGADGTVGVLRLALADLFKTEVKDGYHGQLIVVKPQQRGPFRKDYPMAVSHIAHKLIFFYANKAASNFRMNRWYFTAYSNTHTKRVADLDSLSHCRAPCLHWQWVVAC